MGLNKINAVIDEKARNVEIDIIKGLSIITIIFGHSGVQFLWFSLVYIISFYYVAGYTYRVKPYWEFLKSKFIRIYISFCVANSFGFIIWDLVARFSSYPQNSKTVMEYLGNVVQFDLAFNLMCPCWFLLPLLIITIVFDGMKRIIKNDSVIIMINCLVFIYTCFCKDVWMNDYYWNDAMFVSNVGIGLFIYNLGYIAKKHKGKVEVWLKKFGGGEHLFCRFLY